MRAVDIIQKKRDGIELSKEEIHWLIEGYVAGTVPDYQMAAFAMAVYFKGMTTREISDLTMKMVETGEQFDLSAIKGIKVDKTLNRWCRGQSNDCTGPSSSQLWSSSSQDEWSWSWTYRGDH